MDFVWESSPRNNLGRFVVVNEKEVVGDGSLRTDVAFIY